MAGVGHRASAHQGAPAARGLAGAQFTGGVHDDVHGLRVNAQFFNSYLQGDRVNTLAHLGPAVPDLHPAVPGEPNDSSGDLLEAVSQARVLEPEAQADRSAVSHRLVVCSLHLVQTGPGAKAAVVHDLSGAPDGAWGHNVAATDLPSRDPNLLG